MTETAPKPVLFYDGGCPLCRKEIAHYRRLDRQQRIHWVDIQQDSELLNSNGISLPQAMARIHALTAQGEICTGVEAFMLIWRELPYYRVLPKLIAKLHLTNVLELLYQRFARFRLKRRIKQQPEQCQGRCNPRNES